MQKQQFIPFCRVELTQAEITAVTECLRSGWLTMGNQVQKFEQQFAEYVGVKYAISVNSCTAALDLALLAHNIGKGDEVLVPSFTFVATANVVIHAGAKPVFVDIDKNTLNIDLEDIVKKITKKTKAIIVVHYAGLPVELTKIKKIAKEHNLIIIEDAAHAVGSKYKGKYVGAHGNTTCFSFYATKTMTTGEGGMLTTNNKKIADFVARNRLHGISRDAWKRYRKDGSWKYDVLYAGFKYNMTDVQASLGIHQLSRLEKFIEQRTKIVGLYKKGFSKNKHIQMLSTPNTVRHSYHLCPILVTGVKRDELIKKLTEMEIGTSVHFIPIHQFSYYKKFYPVKKNDLQVTDSVFKHILSLPLFPTLKQEEINRVINAVNALTLDSK
ncbi:MAG: spore coat protein [Patescibacteria group bacterium]|nr:MAG: spore coat protein [Patescibacteria group bacterium]